MPLPLSVAMLVAGAVGLWAISRRQPALPATERVERVEVGTHWTTVAAAVLLLGTFVAALIVRRPWEGS